MSAQLNHQSGISIEAIVDMLRVAKDAAMEQENEFLGYLIEMALHEAITSSPDFQEVRRGRPHV